MIILTDPPVALVGLLLTPAHPGTVFFNCLISSRPPAPGDPRVPVVAREADPDGPVSPPAVPAVPVAAAPPGFWVARNFFHCCKRLVVEKVSGLISDVRNRSRVKVEDN